MCNFLWRINGLIKHFPLNKPTNIDVNRPNWTKTASSFVNLRPVVPSSVYRTADQSINAHFLERKSRTSGKPPRNKAPRRFLFLQRMLEVLELGQ